MSYTTDWGLSVAMLEVRLKVRVEGPCGRELIYPCCDVSRKLADLLGQKTLTKEDAEKLKGLGYVFEVIQEKREI